jgi:hypothetical protein
MTGLTPSSNGFVTANAGATTFSVVISNIAVGTYQNQLFSVMPYAAANAGPVTNLITTVYPNTASATGLTATAGDGQVSLAWTAPTVGITPVTYTVQYRVSGTTSWYLIMLRVLYQLLFPG